MRRWAVYGPKLFLAIITAIAASTLLGQLDGILAGMHLEEDPPYDVGRLTGGMLAPGAPSDVERAVRTWAVWDCGEAPSDRCAELRRGQGGVDRPSSSTPERRHASPGAVVALALLVDLVLIVAYGLVLVAATASAGRSGYLTERATGNWLRVVGVVVVADVVENTALGLSIAATDPVAGAQSLFAHLLAWAAAIAGRVKWWPAIVLLLVLAYSFLLSPHAGRRAAKIFPTIKLLKVSTITLLFVALVLAGPLFAPQIADAIRRWSLLHAVVTAAFALTLAFYVWFTARTPIARVKEECPRPPKDPELLRRTGWLLALGFLWLPVVLFLDVQAFRGVVVPAAITLLLALAGRWLRSREVRLSEPALPARDRYLTSARIPRALGAAVLLVVGVVAVRSAFAELVFHSDRELPVLPALAGTAALGALVWLGFHLAHRNPEESRPARTGAVSYVLIGAMALLAVLLALSEPPQMEQSLSSLTIVLVGLILIAAAMPFYFFLAHVDDQRARGVMGFSVEARSCAEVAGSYVNPVAVVWYNLRTDPRYRLAIAPSLLALAAAIWIYLSPVAAPQRLGATGVVLLAVTLIALVLGGLSWFGERSEIPRLLKLLHFRRVPVFLGVLLWGVVMLTMWKEAGFHDVQVLGRSDDIAATLGSNLGTSEMFDGWERRAEAAFAAGTAPAPGPGEPGETPAPAPEPGEPGETPAPAPEPGATAGLRPARPMVFISAWGGGIRAAVWTAFAVDCAFRPEAASPGCPRPAGPAAGSSASPGFDAVAAASGISGGSVGLANYVAHLVEQDARSGWVRRRLGGDYVAPDLARLVLADIPLTLFGGGPSIPDRADVMQAAWEKSWADIPAGGIRWGINALWDGSFDELPLVVMNSASLNDACAINVSAAQLGVEIDRGRAGNRVDECRSLAPFDKSRTGSGSAEVEGKLVGMRDVNDYLCRGEDISLAAGSLMSARFPAVSPSGRLEVGSCIAGREGFDRDAEGYPDLHSTDGGQLEPSATLTATQLWQAVEDRVEEHNAGPAGYCIAPVLIHLENGFSADIGRSDSGIPNEWLDPLVFSAVKRGDGLIANIRQRAALEFSEPLGDGIRLVGAGGEPVERFAFVRTKANPGPSAPLGWTLSRTTFEDLDDQLQRNAGQFELIDKWLRQPLFCAAEE